GPGRRAAWVNSSGKVPRWAPVPIQWIRIRGAKCLGRKGVAAENAYLQGSKGSRMLPYMKPSNTVWGRVLVCCLAVSGTLGLWAGGAAAQTSDGWFDDSAQAPPPPAADEGDAPSAPSQPDYSPPPADFQTPPPAAAPEQSAEEVNA